MVVERKTRWPRTCPSTTKGGFTGRSTCARRPTDIAAAADMAADGPTNGELMSSGPRESPVSSSRTNPAAAAAPVQRGVTRPASPAS